MDEPRRCKAHTKRGQCKRPPIKGGTVCHTHGGAAPQVKRAADRRIAEYVAQMVDPQRVLAEIARVAMSDPTALFNEKGQIKPMNEWTDEAKAAVASFETVRRNVDSGDGHTDDVLKLKVWDKPKALEMLAKHLSLYEDKTRLDGEITFKWEGE